MSFSSTCLEQLDFEMRVPQIQSDKGRHMLFWRLIVEAFAVCQSERIPISVAVDNLGWAFTTGNHFFYPDTAVLSLQYPPGCRLAILPSPHGYFDWIWRIRFSCVLYRVYCNIQSISLSASLFAVVVLLLGCYCLLFLTLYSKTKHSELILGRKKTLTGAWLCSISWSVSAGSPFHKLTQAVGLGSRDWSTIDISFGLFVWLHNAIYTIFDWLSTSRRLLLVLWFASFFPTGTQK